MSPDYREELRKIRTFPQLVKYLRDELGWPIGSEDFEDLTFDYTPEELGIDPMVAAKIEEIKRLRPLTANQPWGIFFVKFEPKRLPVVALRRILNQVVMKKRASGSRAERVVWETDDLLFISNFGEGDERQICLAHFSYEDTREGLPSLKVLGWDNRDTLLHLEDIAAKLLSNLAWPSDEGDVQSWRARWRSAFTLRHREVIQTSRELSVQLAALARTIRVRIITALGIETERGPLTRLMKSFKEALVHDLDADGFADMYAQTIAYGLLSARVVNPKGKPPAHGTSLILVPNPFLRELLETFLNVGKKSGGGMSNFSLDFDELGVSEIVELLDDANMDAILRDFGDLNPQEDPVIHFYELFLKEYDARRRMQRGVFYTPRPVVRYMVRSLDHILRTEFGCQDGLADTSTIEIDGTIWPRVILLDPAAGTGTFLEAVVDVVHGTMISKWEAQGFTDVQMNLAWNEYVSKSLLPRLYGFELMVAPYTIAHMKLGLKLRETGYQFKSGERLQLYLTNTLEPPSQIGKYLHGFLAGEAQAANKVKREVPISFIIGNPPYSGHSANDNEWIRELLRTRLEDGAEGYFSLDGKDLGEDNPKWLNDDYVKFIRYCQARIASRGYGCLMFITAHGFLDNTTFRGMRHSLLHTFQQIDVLDLHGNVKKGELATSGSPDENVFEIQQGVSISAFIKTPSLERRNTVLHADLFGTRDEKYGALDRMRVDDKSFIDVNPIPDLYLFVPFDATLLEEYNRGWSVKDIFPLFSAGIVTARDFLTIHWTGKEVWDTVSEFSSMSAERARARFDLGSDARDWKVALAQRDLQETGPADSLIVPVLYRPFDIRYTYFTGNSRGFHCMPRAAVMRNFLSGNNLGLVTVRRFPVNAEACYFLVSQQMIVNGTIRSDNQSIDSFFPLYRVESGIKPVSSIRAVPKRAIKASRDQVMIPNIAPSLIEFMSNRFALKFISEGRGDLTRTFGPEDFLSYLYAICYSPSYRLRYRELLAKDYPRIPITSNLGLFREICLCGRRLISLHVLYEPNSPGKNVDNSVRLSGKGDNHVAQGYPRYDAGRIWMNSAQSFEKVAEDVWRFRIGTYQVCEKWLKDRRGRLLSPNEVLTYNRILEAIDETIRTMKLIDRSMDKYGGWPLGEIMESPEAKTAKHEPSRLEDPKRPSLHSFDSG